MSFAAIALYAWIPLSLGLFAWLRPRHAVLATYLGGWLFLPLYGVKISVLPDINKASVVSMAALLGVCIFDHQRVMKFRLRWFDLPMLAWCVTPFISSIENGLGAWDGVSAILQHLMLWGGIPYFLGRLYFADWEGSRDLAIAIFAGGIIYMPLCWIEMRFSPQLHKWVYGFHQHSFAQAKRDGGYRPMVFMQHGLAVSMWMVMASLVGVWLWATNALKTLWGMHLQWLVPLLLITTLLCRSTGAMLCLGAGLGCLFWFRYVRNALPLYCLVLLIPSYMVLRTNGMLSAERILDTASHFFEENRVQSLATRVNAEDLLSQRAMQRPYFGWGRWSPADPAHPPWRIYNEKGKDIAPTDGMWVIVLGTCGIFGLAALTIAMLLPALQYRFRVPVGWWAHPMAAPGAVLCVLLALHMIDNLANAMVNPIFVLAVGGLSALGVIPVQTQAPLQAFPVIAME